MQIARNLKLVIPIYEGDELRLSVYAEPLSRLAFEANHKIMGRAWTDLNKSGIGSVGLMTTAMYALKEAAIGLYGETEGIVRFTAFSTELLRTAMAIVPHAGSWQPIPYENAKATGMITEEDVATVESLIAFFTLAFRMTDPYWAIILRTAVQLNYGAQFISLSCMEFITSLKTSSILDVSGKAKT